MAEPVTPPRPTRDRAEFARQHANGQTDLRRAPIPATPGGALVGPYPAQPFDLKTPDPGSVPKGLEFPKMVFHANHGARVDPVAPVTVDDAAEAAEAAALGWTFESPAAAIAARKE